MRRQQLNGWLIAWTREAEIGQDMEEPQQYGIWHVAGLGLVIAFRGTASSEDVFIDVNITPVALSSSGAPFGECSKHLSSVFDFFWQQANLPFARHSLTIHHNIRQMA